jgi:hypothetical protein
MKVNHLSLKWWEPRRRLSGRGGGGGGDADEKEEDEKLGVVGSFAKKIEST